MILSETGKTVFDRTYSRVKPNGERETWPETVERVVDGNLALAPERHQLPGERDDLIRMMTEFKVIPAGRHLWASGVKGRQYLFNCHVAGWHPEDPAEHFRFTFLRLMEGGGVGANYSNSYLAGYPEFDGAYEVHIVCSPDHPDYEAMLTAGLLSPEFDADWPGAFPVEDSREGWADALVDLFEAYYTGAVHPDRVYDVSRVRSSGSRLKTFGGRASGPLPLGRMLHDVSHVLNRTSKLTGIDAMEIDHAIATCVVSGGNRRSARMAIMHWADPQVDEFLRIKQDSGSHWTTNISVEVDEDFWASVEWSAESEYRWHSADDVLKAISTGMLANGEPGIWDSSVSNEGEPNPVIATNPCGEIALEAWENCNLGHVNLAAFVREDNTTDVDDLIRAHTLMTRFLIRATYGDVTDDKQRVVLARNRRVGVGHLGVASYLAMQGVRYADAPFNPTMTNMLDELYDTVWDAAEDYADALRIPVPVKCTTVAPTGTIAKLPGVSEGIHPIYAKYFIRRIRFSDVDEDQRATVERYRAEGYQVEPCLYAPATSVVSIPTMDSLLPDVVSRGWDVSVVQSADDLTLPQMLAFQSMYQMSWADNAVSYTANINPDEYTPQAIADHLMDVSGEIKGATVFPALSMEQAPYERLTEAEFVEASMFKPAAVADSVDVDCNSGACPVR